MNHDDSSGSKEPMILDADKSYPVDAIRTSTEVAGAAATTNYIAPIAPPIEPPYQASIERQKQERRNKRSS
jgi:hypothetical protein